MRERTWALLFILLILLCALIMLLLPRGGNTVGIWQQGELVSRVDLDTLSAPYTLTLTYDAGETLVHMDREGVYIESADCKNQNCVRHAPLRHGGTPIVCLPERIVIFWLRDEGGVDAVSG